MLNVIRLIVNQSLLNNVFFVVCIRLNGSFPVDSNHQISWKTIDQLFFDKLSCRYPKALCISESAYNLDRIRESIGLQPVAVIVSCLPLLLRSVLEREEFMDAVGRTLMPGGLLVQYS